MEDDNKIWVVVGESEEYSDRTEWLVSWFRTEEEANLHAYKLQTTSDHLECTPWSRERDMKVMKAAGDPAWWPSYSVVRYRVEAVPAGPVK